MAKRLLPGVFFRTKSMKKYLISTLALLLTTPFSNAAEDPLVKCRQIKDVEERVKCYDRFVDRIASEPVSRPIPTHSSAPSPSLVEARITRVKRSADKKIVVTLDNGQIWRQIDNEPIVLRNGDEIIVRPARLGSYLMEKRSGSGRIRVKQ